MTVRDRMVRDQKRTVANIREATRQATMARFQHEHAHKLFRVDGFGEVGIANLYKFVANDDQKSHYDLEVGESTYGVAAGIPEKVTRIR